MLARKMKLKLNGFEVGTTPMLVPAFSSKANMDICKTIKTMSEFIYTPILVSAYDVNHTEEFPPITFPDLIFLDSGGYECLIDKDVSEIGFYQPEADSWNSDMHLEVLQNWPTDIPTVIISYDNPSIRKSGRVRRSLNRHPECQQLFQCPDVICESLCHHRRPLRPSFVPVINFHSQ